MREGTALDVILGPGGLTARFQPILHVTDTARRIASYECLTRGPHGTNMEPANVLFDYVRLKREESAIDRACVVTALECSMLIPGAPRLGINVHASTLGRDHEFVPFLCDTAADKGIALSRLTVEVVEHAPPWDGTSFLRALDALRQKGVAIALDDVGLGQSNFKMILDVHPDFLKIDRYFIHGCGTDPDRQSVIEAILQLARRFGAQIVAEGIENEDDFHWLRTLGVDLFQGHLFSAALPIEQLVKWRPTDARAEVRAELQPPG